MCHSGARPTFLGELCAPADALREDLGLTGIRLGCEHGVCGCCTILLNGAPARSCLLLAARCGGRPTSAPSRASRQGRRKNPSCTRCRKRSLRSTRSSAGYCTPGFLMLLAGERAADPGLDLDEEKLSQVLASNLCRCTGYVGVRRAAVAGGPAGREGPADPGDPAGPGDRRPDGPGRQPGRPDGPGTTRKARETRRAREGPAGPEGPGTREARETREGPPGPGDPGGPGRPGDPAGGPGYSST